jgi:hypothetical protein
MTRPQGIDENNLPIGLDKGKIIISSIPDNHLRLSFSRPQYLFIIHTCIDGDSRLYERLKFFSLLDGTGLFLHILPVREPKHRLELTISHRMPDHRHLETFLFQKSG